MYYKHARRRIGRYIHEWMDSKHLDMCVKRAKRPARLEIDDASWVGGLDFRTDSQGRLCMRLSRLCRLGAYVRLCMERVGMKNDGWAPSPFRF